MMNIDSPHAAASEMLMLINGYSFNNTINANPGTGPPFRRDMRNSALKQIVNENPSSNRVYNVNDIGIRIHLEKRRSVNSRPSRTGTLRCL
jgi:hypothetical protein